MSINWYYPLDPKAKWYIIVAVYNKTTYKMTK